MTTKEEDQTGLAGLESQFAQMTTDTQRTVPQLKQFCRDKKIKGFSALNKEGLQKLIEDHGTTLQKAEMDAVIKELANLFKTCSVYCSMLETLKLNKLKETEELTKVQKYADILKEVIDWKRLARIIKATGSSLNGPKERFDKSDILEQAVCEYSTEKGRFTWEDKVGYDILDKATGSKIELKYVENALITKGGKEKEVTGGYRLKNHLSSKKVKNEESGIVSPTIKRPADFYLLMSKRKCVLTTYELMIPFLVESDDATSLNKMPLNKTVIISKFEEDEITIQDSNLQQYIDRKRQMQTEYIKSIL